MASESIAIDSEPIRAEGIIVKYLCVFVALSVRMCIAGTNKVGGTMSWLLGTNEILASKHEIAALKVKQGHFETPLCFSTILSSSITAKSV